MKTTFKKALSIVLCLALILSFAACAKQSGGQDEETTAQGGESSATSQTAQQTYDKAPKSVVKSETVYANIDSTGKTQQIIVSDWLHTDSAGVKVQDKSDLTDIINVKGTEQPQIKGSDVTWNMSSTDLYYRGYSTKQLPITLTIKYYLNDKEVKPEELKEATGKVKIEVSAQNDSFETIKVGGKEVKVFEPMIVAGGMILPGSQFSNVSITNGKALSDGEKEIAMFVGLPGLAQSFSFTEKELEQLRNEVFGGMDFSGKFVIEADAKDFSLGNMYFAALPLSSVEGSMQVDETLSGVSGMLSSLSEVVNAIYDIDVDNLIDTLMSNSDKINEFADLITKAKDVYDDNKVLIDLVSVYATKENIEKTEKLASDVEALDLEKYSELLSSPEMKALIDDISKTDFSKYEKLLTNPLFTAFFKDLSTLMGDAGKVLPQLESVTEDVSSGKFEKVMSDYQALSPTITALSNDLSTPEAQKALKKLPETVETVKSMLGTLEENEDLIKQLSSAFDSEKVDALNKALKDSENISINTMMKSIKRLTDDPKGTTKIMDKMNDLAQKNNIYSLVGDGMDTSVVYVYRTPAIG